MKPKFNKYLIILCACFGALNLTAQQKQYYLYQQIIIGNNAVDADQILSIIPQKPNQRLLGSPFRSKLWHYNKGKEKHEQQLKNKVFENKIELNEKKFNENTKDINVNSAQYRRLKEKKDEKVEKYQKKINEGNWRMTALGEPPVYFDALETQKNCVNITKYLNKKGYFNAKTSFVVDTLNTQNVKLTYIISENIGYKITDIKYQIADPNIESVIYKEKSKSYLTVNQVFDEASINNERLRIENMLRNKGYYTFTRNQIKIKVYYLPNNPANGVQLIVIIENAEGGESQKYEIENIDFIIDASGTNNTLNEGLVTIDTTFKNGINYIFAGQKFSTKYLHRKIFLKKGNYYSQQDQFDTQKALQTLDQFKFANPSFDTLANKLKVRFYAIPLEKYQFTGETGMNVFQGIPGPFGNVTLKIRNIFGGLESLETSARVGWEGQPGFTNTDNRNFEVGFNSSVNIPLIVLPGSYIKLDKYSPRTQVGIGLNYAKRYEYQRLNFRLATNYNFQISQKKQFNFSLIDLNLINTPYLRPSFDSTLQLLSQNGNNLKESFGKSFVSSLSGSYVYNDNILTQNQKGKYLRLYAELGGNLLNFTKNGEISLVNNILGNNLNYFKYIRVLADYRKFLPIGYKHKSILAYRVNTGLSMAYGSKTGALPYEKYLFAGGSYSNRAWEPRRLGLNRFNNTSSDTPDYQLEQPGNLLLETSVEYRFPLLKMVGQLNGAYFIDAGNVWTIKNNNNELRQSDFRLNNFMNQIAAGTGFGLRYDFTYFIIRLDAAAKVFEPLYGKGKGFVLDDFFKKNKDNNLKLNWNIGIGYPF